MRFLTEFHVIGICDLVFEDLKYLILKGYVILDRIDELSNEEIEVFEDIVKKYKRKSISKMNKKTKNKFIRYIHSLMI